MASSVSDASVLDELSDNFLQCPVHLDRFEKPKMLPCLHSVCLVCLEQWQQQMGIADQVTCPQCRKVCTVPSGGVQEFPDNFLINSLLDYVEQLSSDGDSSKKCDICAKDTISSEMVRCADCSMYLCSSCTASHKKIPSTVGHQLIPIEEFDRFTVAEKLNTATPLCPKHSTSRLEFFCVKCKAPVCTQCTVVAHKAPVHSIQELTEAYTKIRKQLKDVLKGSIKKHPKMQQAIADMTVAMTELETKRDLAYETCQQQANAIIDSVSLYLTDIEEKIDHEYTEQKEVLDERLDELLQLDEDNRHTEEFAERIMQFGNQVTVSSVGPDIICKLKDLQCQFQRKNIPPKASLSFSVNDQFKSQICSESIGLIEGAETSSETWEELSDDLSAHHISSKPACNTCLPSLDQAQKASAENTFIQRLYKGKSYPGRRLNLSIRVHNAYGNLIKEDIKPISNR